MRQDACSFARAVGRPWGRVGVIRVDACRQQRVTCMAGRRASSSSSSSRGRSGQPGTGQPAWKRYAKKDKALGRQAEATLEMIWSKTAWLTDEHIQGMWDEHRVRKDVVVAWFAQKRLASRRQKKLEEGAGGEDGDDDLGDSEEESREGRERGDE